MIETLGLVIHITAGTLSLLSGFAALFFKKGSIRHRLAGKWFVSAMSVMTLSGAAIAWFYGVSISILAGLLSFYLVVSAWLTIRPLRGQLRANTLTMSGLGACVFSFALYASWQAHNGIIDNIDGFIVPAEVYFGFTFFVTMGLIGDVYLAWKVHTSRRYILCRHIWRMCIPMYLAASSFFEGQADVFPEAWRYTFYLSIPQNLVFLLMLYWLGHTVLHKKVTLLLKRSA